MNVPEIVDLSGFYVGFIVLGKKSREAKGHEIPSRVRGHAPRKFFKMNAR